MQVPIFAAIFLLGVLSAHGKKQTGPVTLRPLCVKPLEKTVKVQQTRTIEQLLTLDHDTIDVAFFDTRKMPDVASIKRASQALRNSSTYAQRIRFHIITAVPTTIPGFTSTPLRLPKHGQCIYDGLKRLSHGPGPHYLYKPLLHWVLPTSVRRLILLDNDISLVRDVAELYAEFSRFNGAMVGIANEQSNLYQSSSGWKLIGKNGGVQLLDLEAMRASEHYAALLDHVASGKDGRHIGFLGDQTLYTYLAADAPQLMYTLPCEWNRQIAMQFGFGNATVHKCKGRCGALHANFAPLKCVARLMQESPSCETWKAFSENLPYLGPSCPKMTQGRRATLRRAIGNYFGDCCVASVPMVKTPYVQAVLDTSQYNASKRAESARKSPPRRPRRKKAKPNSKPHPRAS